MGRLFGTDGVRGVANADLTAELALGLSVAAAHVLAEAGTFEGHRPVAVVGRDPRASGEFLEAAVVAGLASAGVDVLRVGVLPTPAVAYLTGSLGADLGVMLSASHNPMPDNGIKFFARGGHKLADELENRIEQTYRAHSSGEPWERPTGAGVGRVTVYDEGFDNYVAHLVGVLPNRLDGLKIVIDGAHGAAARVSPEAFARAGADVVTIGTDPDGLNINDGCGSTHLRCCARPSSSTAPTWVWPTTATPTAAWPWTARATRSTATRSWPSWRSACARPGTLRKNTVVATVMSNLGFKLAMEREGIDLVADRGRRPVRPGGDEGARLRAGRRAVRACHRAGPRHHRRRHADRPDAGVPGSPRPAGRWPNWRGVMERLPQILINVPDVDKSRVDHLARADRGGRRGGAGAGRHRPGAAAAVRHGAAGAGDGRGRGHRAGPVGRRAARRRGQVARWAEPFR